MNHMRIVVSRSLYLSEWVTWGPVILISGTLVFCRDSIQDYFEGLMTLELTVMPGAVSLPGVCGLADDNTWRLNRLWKSCQQEGHKTPVK